MFTLDREVEQVEAELGKGILPRPELRLTRGYDNQTKYSFSVEESVAVRALITAAQLPSALGEELFSIDSISQLSQAAQARTEGDDAEHIARLTGLVSNITSEGGLKAYIYKKYFINRVPRFLYFDEYYMMRGHENIEALKQRRAENRLEPHDRPLLGLIELARLQLDELLNPDRTQWLVNKLEGAGNHLSKKVLRYWSQNKNLSMRFDVRPARPNDPEGMRQGTNFWARVYDSKRMVTTTLGSRSRGFVWFFSFLAWFDQQQRVGEPLILLLDEPGLFLHGRAQGDLLRYMEEELEDNYQVIYTTHSPFMVDPQHFDRVRIVQDKSMETDQPLPPDQDGTKIITDVLEATEDSLFPLQGALGYDIHQSLFIGPNSLVVEGVSDLLYIQAMSALLSSLGRESLSEKWTITPVGGAEKVPTFVALLGAQQGLKIATLLDIQKKDQQTIENLYKRKLLKKQNVFTFADFTSAKEADIEDMFGDTFYLELVNGEYGAHLAKPVTSSMLKSKAPRIIVRLEQHFDKNPLQGGVRFNHYRPARYLVDNLAQLEKSVPDEVKDRFEEAFKALNALL